MIVLVLMLFLVLMLPLVSVLMIPAWLSRALWTLQLGFRRRRLVGVGGWSPKASDRE